MNIELAYPFKTRELLEIRDNFSITRDVRSNLLLRIQRFYSLRYQW